MEGEKKAMTDKINDGGVDEKSLNNFGVEARQALRAALEALHETYLAEHETTLDVLNENECLKARLAAMTAEPSDTIRQAVANAIAKALPVIVGKYADPEFIQGVINDYYEAADAAIAAYRKAV